MNAEIEIKDISRPPRGLIDALATIGAATLSSELSRHMGIRDPQIRGVGPCSRVAQLGFERGYTAPEL